MLVLSRKQSQRIRLGDSIVITVVRLTGDKVRLGIEAPKDMLVLRDELETFDPGKATAQRTSEPILEVPTEPPAPIGIQQTLPLQRSA